ncbi:hypothetical protein EVAR_67988_1 [Eumeta japonica]|uniref:Uncharacterized protein n=1 Tax=Eumeta variegata TaxID=151549 RepID=A0A4C1ZU90_EUMVA|nr:hypothetical protein EVAR_67988_1 [Eumeta japonica]
MDPKPIPNSSEQMTIFTGSEQPSRLTRLVPNTRHRGIIPSHAYGAVEEQVAEHMAPWIATVLFQSASLLPAFEAESCCLCGHTYDFSISVKTVYGF